MSLSILPLTRDLLSYNRFSGVRCLSRTQFSSVSDRFAHAVEQLGKFRAEGVSGVSLGKTISSPTFSRRRSRVYFPATASNVHTVQLSGGCRNSPAGGGRGAFRRTRPNRQRFVSSDSKYRARSSPHKRLPSTYLQARPYLPPTCRHALADREGWRVWRTVLAQQHLRCRHVSIGGSGGQGPAEMPGAG